MKLRVKKGDVLRVKTYWGKTLHYEIKSIHKGGFLGDEKGYTTLVASRLVLGKQGRVKGQWIGIQQDKFLIVKDSTGEIRYPYCVSVKNLGRLRR